MIKYFTYASMLSVAIIYTLMLNILLKRNHVFDNATEEIIDVPDKVLVYIEENDELSYKNFDEDILKHVKNVEKNEEKTIPRHGIYKFTISEKDGKKTIIGIPS